MTDKLEIEMAKMTTHMGHIKGDVKDIKETMATKESVGHVRDDVKEIKDSMDNMATNESVDLKVNSVKGTLSIHLTLILALIAGVVSLGLWWMRVGMGK